MGLRCAHRPGAAVRGDEHAGGGITIEGLRQLAHGAVPAGRAKSVEQGVPGGHDDVPRTHNMTAIRRDPTGLAFLKAPNTSPLMHSRALCDEIRDHRLDKTNRVELPLTGQPDRRVRRRADRSR